MTSYTDMADRPTDEPRSEKMTDSSRSISVVRSFLASPLLDPWVVPVFGEVPLCVYPNLIEIVWKCSKWSTLTHFWPCFFVDSDCLKIASYDGRVTPIASTNTTLVLRLSPWRPPENYPDISRPSVKYIVYYKRANGVDNSTMCDRIPAACDKKVSKICWKFLTVMTKFTANFWLAGTVM